MDVLMGSFPKFSLKLYFPNGWVLSRTPMDVSEWIKKNIQKCLNNSVDFQMAFNLCCKTIGTKAKRNDRY